MTDRSTKGINWGQMQIDDRNLIIDYKGKNIMKIPLKKITNSSVNKNDVIVEINTEDIKDDEDTLCECRFFIQPQDKDKVMSKEGENSQASGEKENGSQKGSDEDIPQKETLADKINEEIIQKAQINQFAGDTIVSFQELHLAVPRGKYSVDMFKSSIKFHGTSFNYMIEYKNIQKTFLLPLSDEVQVAFVIQLDQPIKQGNTIYPYIVILFKKDQEEIVKIKLKPDEIKNELNGLEEEYKGPLNETIATLFKLIVKCNVIIPGDFLSFEKQKCVKSTYKTQQGNLFPLQKSILFIFKPVFYISHNEIQSAEFHRVGGAGQLNKLFDLKIITKNQKIVFAGIERQEFDQLWAYFQKRQIQTKKIADELTNKTYEESSDSGIDDEGEGKQKKQKKDLKNIRNEDYDDEDESDEDYKGEEEEEEEEEEDQGNSDNEDYQESGSQHNKKGKDKTIQKDQ